MDQVFTLTVHIKPIQIRFELDGHGSLKPETMGWKSLNKFSLSRHPQPQEPGEFPQPKERRKEQPGTAKAARSRAKNVGKRKIRTLLKTTNWSYKQIAREVNRLCKPFQTTNKSVGHMAWRMWNLNQAKMPVWRHSDRPSGAMYKMKPRLKPLKKRNKPNV